MSPSRSTRDLSDRMSVTWVNVFGNMKVLTLDGETGVRPKEVDDSAMYNQDASKHEAFHKTAWLVERHNAPIVSALQRADSQVIGDLLWVSFVTVSGLVTSMHNAMFAINSHTFYQALLGRQPHLFPLIEGWYHGVLDTKGQNN